MVYDILLTDDEKFHEQFNLFVKEIYAQQGYNVLDYPVNFASMVEYPVPDHNICMETIDIDAFGRPAYNSFSIDTYSSKHYSKLTKTDDTTYPCLVRIETKVKPYQSAQFIEDTFFYKYLLVSNKDTGLTFDYYQFPYTSTWNRGLFPYNKNGTDLTVGNPIYWDKMRYPYSMPYTLSRIISLSGIFNDLNVTDDYQAHLNSLLSSYGNFYSASGDIAACGFPYRTNRVQSPSSMHQQVLFVSRITQVPEWLPIFDAENVEGIKKYLETGDDSGKIDPFDPNTPVKEKVENYHTNFKVFITPSASDSEETHFSISAYNNDYRDGGEYFKGLYKFYVAKMYSDNPWTILNTEAVPYTPVFSYTELIPRTERTTTLRLKFTNAEETETSAIFDIYINYDESKKANIKIQGVQVLTDNFAPAAKSNILDGYRYTANTGEYVDIIYRGMGISDLNSGYSDEEDQEDGRGGTDSDFLGASGLHTFLIDNSDLSVINKKLWSTDWTAVFKSTSIDPIKCIISAKAIPFSADGQSSAEIIIANLDTGLSKNYVKTVKSFNIGSIQIPAYNKDFTDITMLKIHCYLPFIGWVELPASECVSRYEYTSVGIGARPKTLKFKYLVDFVDSTVRCIVSVNDTERWFFDGMCGIDIPLTSDNHTQAVSNSIRSGISTALSIGSMVGGALSENVAAVGAGLLGTIQNAPNIYPTYSYTATSNGSGLITQSMINHIMIVIERPNVQRPSDFAKRVGRPCRLTMSLGGLKGFTQAVNPDLSGVPGTGNELELLKSMLESGIYL